MSHPPDHKALCRPARRSKPGRRTKSPQPVDSEPLYLGGTPIPPEFRHVVEFVSHLTPKQFLAVLIKAFLGDRVTVAEVQSISNSYDDAIKNWGIWNS